MIVLSSITRRLYDHKGEGLVTLKMLRESHLMTQAALAQKVGVQVTTVSNWERGEQRPQLSIMSRLAEIFGLTPQEIIAIIDETMAKK